MRSEYDPKRRAITVGAALALLGYPIITLTGCGGSDNPANPNPNPTPTPSSGDVQGSIAGNHGHAVAITSAELQTGGALTLTFTGTATHTHSISLSGTEVVSIRGAQRVSTTSTTTNGHMHTVTFN